MKHLEFKRLKEVPVRELIELMSHPRVQAQMPLIKGEFDEKACLEFVQTKEALWEEHGYGPWAIYLDNCFAGWGGIQPEMGESDLVMVLHPRYWGSGMTIVQSILSKAFFEMRKASVVILFPPTRKRIRSLYRLGFKREKEVKLKGESFIVYRLFAKDAQRFLSIHDKEKLPVLEVRLARASEAETLSKLACRSKSSWPYDPEYLELSKDAIKVTHKDIEQWPFVVIEMDHQLVGFSGVCNVDGESMLDHLWVDPDYMSRGLGRLLFQEAVVQARRLGWSQFKILADPYAEPFYLKMGAKRVGLQESKLKKGFFLPVLELCF